MMIHAWKVMSKISLDLKNNCRNNNLQILYTFPLQSFSITFKLQQSTGRKDDRTT
jgi:hypothetical protein